MTQERSLRSTSIDSQPLIGLRYLDAIVLPDRIVVYARNSEDVLPDLMARLEALGVSVKVEFESPCG
ncbi:hypothetical protein HKBW3S44_01289 [Candidatus Hakubella thermalkaliphila]|uniref:Uncharacterized protein n=1 Tax=Candidatus Hakubella thermalkaliphila TaxID=2754717 RepID=A0A6V8Q4M8_9ACTN|nr:hypothetical protein [Bacillota bacterium]MBT9169841.1 hypothetical protein [Actinomycetota bacterium]GFP30744.1 hypothetical protein HKBW3S34_01663 [Candidatus Hakubella thermalkaliphila]GFP37613.1 hypothetical protein HKBW3S44_01289 [Candidatus Hakubella thermalkaliphila]GFP39729.1 hypothetical protein HKBW3S47_01427 [Candidatus Hakubella thermalkaliphila]